VNTTTENTVESLESLVDELARRLGPGYDLQCDVDGDGEVVVRTGVYFPVTARVNIPITKG